MNPVGLELGSEHHHHNRWMSNLRRGMPGNQGGPGSPGNPGADVPAAAVFNSVETALRPCYAGVGTPGRLGQLTIGTNLAGLSGVVSKERDSEGKFEFLLLDGRRIGNLSDNFVCWLGSGEVTEDYPQGRHEQ